MPRFHFSLFWPLNRMNPSRIPEMTLSGKCQNGRFQVSPRCRRRGPRQKVTPWKQLFSGKRRLFPGKAEIQGALAYTSDQFCQESQECVFPGMAMPGNRLFQIQILFNWFGAGSVFSRKVGKRLSVWFGEEPGKAGKVTKIGCFPAGNLCLTEARTVPRAPGGALGRWVYRVPGWYGRCTTPGTMVPGVPTPGIPLSGYHAG